MIKSKFGTVLILIFCCKGCPVWIVPFGRADMKGKKVILFFLNSPLLMRNSGLHSTGTRLRNEGHTFCCH